MADDNNQLFKEIDRSTIETCAGGYDSRPFNSKLYLNAPFNTEFLAALTWDESHNSSTSTANLVHVDEKSAGVSPADNDEGVAFKA